MAQDEKDSLKTNLTVYPLLFYYPETRLGLGVTGVCTFYAGKEKSNRPSQVLTGLAYTWNKQVLLSSFFDLFLDEDRIQVEGELAYYDYFYPYYGLSNESQPEDKEKYFVRFPRIRVNALRTVYPNVKAGVGFDYDNYDIQSVEENGLLDLEKPLGWDGNTVLNASVILRLDSRDRVFSPKKGALVTLTQSLSPEGWGTGTYSRTEFNGAVYQGLWQQSVLAVNLKGGHIDGEIPFQETFYLGGSKSGRGIILGRYRGKDKALLQAEIRQQFLPRWSAVLLGSAGTIGDTFQSLFENKYHLNGGAGIRFVLQQSTGLNFRMDAAHGDEGWQWYISVGEAF